MHGANMKIHLITCREFRVLKVKGISQSLSLIQPFATPSTQRVAFCSVVLSWLTSFWLAS